MKQQRSIKELCRDLRKNLTPEEGIMWDRLRNRKLAGFKFLRQHPIIYSRNYKGVDFFIADFYCAEKKIVVEVDGGIHVTQMEYDEQRTYLLIELGISVIRFKNEQVINDIDFVITEIITKCQSSPLYG